VHFALLGSPLNLNRNLNLCRLGPKWSEIKIRIRIKIKKRQPKKMKCTPRGGEAGLVGRAVHCAASVSGRRSNVAAPSRGGQGTARPTRVVMGNVLLAIGREEGLAKRAK
jgi:hypothetical protein